MIQPVNPNPVTASTIHSASQIVIEMGVFEGWTGANARGAGGRFERWDKDTSRLVTKGNIVMAAAAERALRREFRRHDPTGHGASMESMRARPLPYGFGVQITIGGGAVFVEEGVRPHMIRPAPGGILRYPWSGAPDEIMRNPNPVMHPGVIADKFVERAMADTKADYIATMQRLVNQAYTTFSVVDEDFEMHERYALAKAKAWQEKMEGPA